MSYTVSRTFQNGIERVVYTPYKRRFATPIVQLHSEVPDAGHDLMLERSYAETVRLVHEWLAARVV